MSNNINQEARLQSLLNWKNSLELKRILEAQGIEFKSQDYLAQLTYKIAEKAFGKQGDQGIETKVCEMVEQQTCAICFELMVPPIYSPILLFPCGHTFCKECILTQGKLKIKNCSLCRALINAHAPNLNLQNLICTFSEQKLQQKQQQKPQMQQDVKVTSNDNQYSIQYKQFKLRCEILQSERDLLIKEQKQQQQQLAELEIQLSDISAEREELIQVQQDIQCKIERIEDSLKKIVDNSQSITIKVHSIKEKIKVLDETLQPLVSQMKKYEILSKQQQ